MEPQPPSDDDAHLQPLVDYLEQHRQQINLEALRKELLTAGHPPELVDEAVRRVQGNPIRKARAWPFGLLIVLANLVVIGLIEAGLNALIPVLPSPFNVIFGWIAIGSGPVLLLGEIIVGARLSNGPRERLGRALIWGAVFSVLFTVVLIILALGACFVLLSGAFGQ
jgi:hypothetical protein